MRDAFARAWGLLRRLVVVGLLALIALGVLGQVVRDRSAAWAILMYLPLPLIGPAAAGFDLICRGRALPIPRARFALGLVGLATTLGSVVPLVGWGDARITPAPPASGREIKVLHWNVIWGGGKRRDPARWASIRRTIRAEAADLVVLSEAPPDDWLDELVADMGPGATRVQVENGPGVRYWYKLVVCSRLPLRLVATGPVANGAAMAVEAGDRGAVVRLLVVDGQSNPFRARTPFLHDVARLCREATAAARPFDLVVGDFNSLARSVGFDSLRAEGFTPASRAAGTWRGTFPSFLPVYDIDHLWARAAWLPGMTYRAFTNLASDHRGQVARFRVPAAAPR